MLSMILLLVTSMSWSMEDTSAGMHIACLHCSTTMQCDHSYDWGQDMSLKYYAYSRSISQCSDLPVASLASDL